MCCVLVSVILAHRSPKGLDSHQSATKKVGASLVPWCDTDPITVITVTPTTSASFLLGWLGARLVQGSFAGYQTPVGLWDPRQSCKIDPNCCKPVLIPLQKCFVYSTWRPGINASGRNSFYMDLFWPIKCASTGKGFEFPAVALYSKPQTFSTMSLVLEKESNLLPVVGWTNPLLFQPEPSRSPGLPWPCTPQTIIAAVTREDSGQLSESGQSKPGGGNMCPRAKTSVCSLQGAREWGAGLQPSPSRAGARSWLHIAGIQLQGSTRRR